MRSPDSSYIMSSIFVDKIIFLYNHEYYFVRIMQQMLHIFLSILYTFSVSLAIFWIFSISMYIVLFLTLIISRNVTNVLQVFLRIYGYRFMEIDGKSSNRISNLIAIINQVSTRFEKEDFSKCSTYS
jgi:hypothetical protein